LRFVHLSRPVRYDEAATYTAFASRPLYLALSLYPYPNNHLLNTFFVHFSTMLFGNNLIALRLPVFIAGCLTIPAAWFVARALYGPIAALLTAGCVAALPEFIAFSVNARGYAYQWLCILAMIWLGKILSETPDRPAGWLAFVIAGVLGMYAVPTMIIPLTGICAWMLVRGGIRLLRPLLFAGLSIGLIAFLLYLPALVVSGPVAIIHQTTSSHHFFADFGQLLHDTWMRWTEGVPAPAVWILIAGFIIGLAIHRRPVPLIVVLAVTSFAIAWARSILGFPRVWSYLLLVGVMTASAGVAHALVRAASRLFATPEARVIAAATASLALTAYIGWGLLNTRILFRTNDTGAMNDAPEVAEFLIPHLHPGDTVVTTVPVDAPLDYELLRRNPRLRNAITKSPGDGNVFLVAPKSAAESESYTVEERERRLAGEPVADPAILHEQIDLSRFQPPQLLATFPSATVYSVQRR
jgi:hypothetical protein